MKFDPKAFVVNISLNFLHLLKNGAITISTIHHVGAIRIQQAKKCIGPQKKQSKLNKYLCFVI
jgi:hypothetical protein